MRPGPNPPYTVHGQQSMFIRVAGATAQIRQRITLATIQFARNPF